MFTLKKLPPFLFFHTFSSFSGDILCAEKTWSCGSVLFKIRFTMRRWANCTPKKTGKKLDLEVKAYGFREMPDKLGVAFRTGEGIPDLVQLDETFSEFSSTGLPLRRFDALVKKSGLAKSLHPRRLEVFTYKGKVLGVPQSLSAMVLYYRKDLFKELEVDPKELETWDDMAKVGQRLQDKHGQRFMALDGTLFDVLLRQRGTICSTKRKLSS